MTILEAIQHAKNYSDIRHALNLGNSLRPSGKTRRGWLKAAQIRLTELGIPRLTRREQKELRNGVQVVPKPKEIVL